MKKKAVLFLSILMMAISLAYSFTDTWDWCAINESSYPTDHFNITAIATDDSSNIYSVGLFRGSIQLGDISLETPNLTSDMYGFVAKQAPNGDWIWVQTIVASNPSLQPNSIVLDENNDIYIGGYFDGNLQFGGISLNEQWSGSEGFVAKIDSNGNWQWARAVRGDISYVSKLAVGTNGLVYMIGGMRNSATFGAIFLVAGGINNYLASISPTGEWQMAVALTWPAQTIFDLSLDSMNNIVIVGSYRGMTGGQWYDEPGILFFTPQGVSNGYVSFQATNGSVRSVCHDSEDNVIVSGHYSGSSATFGGIVLPSTSENINGFIAKLNPAREWLWAQKTPTSSFYIDADSQGNVIVVNQAGSSYTFGPFLFTSDYATNWVAMKLDKDGNWNWIKSFSGSANNVYSTVDAAGSVICAGGLSDYSYDQNFIDYNGQAHVLSNSIHSFIIKTKPWVLNITSPNGSEVLQGNDSALITWEVMDLVQMVYLDYSSDGGDTWIPIVDVPIASVTGQYQWQVPNISSDSALVRIKSVAHPTVYSISEAPFTIQEELFPPIVSFSADATSGIEPHPVQFTDLSEAVSGTISSWFWTFGDGQTSDLQNPLHTYTEYGVYDVSLTVINSHGLSTTLNMESYINVISSNALLSDLSTDSLNFGSMSVLQATPYQEISFMNSGSVTMDITDIHFIDAQSQFEYVLQGDAMNVPANGQAVLSLRFVPQTVGAVSDTLYIINSSINEPMVKIRLSGVGLNVPPKAPQNVTAQIDGFNCVISWDAVSENENDQAITPDFYFVYTKSSGSDSAPLTFLGLSTGTDFIHYGATLGADRMLYAVKSVVFYREAGGGDKQDAIMTVPTLIQKGMTEAEVSAILESEGLTASGF